MGTCDNCGEQSYQGRAISEDTWWCKKCIVKHANEFLNNPFFNKDPWYQRLKKLGWLNQ